MTKLAIFRSSPLFSFDAKSKQIVQIASLEELHFGFVAYTWLCNSHGI